MLVIKSTQKQYQATFWYNNKGTTTINLNSIEDLKNKLNLEYTNTNCQKIRVFDALIEDIEGVGIVPTLKKIINVKRVDNQWVASKTHLDIKNFIDVNKKNDFTFFLDCYQKDLITTEGDMWQDLNPIVVLLQDIEQYKKDGFSTCDELETSKKMIHDFMIKYS